MVYWAVFQSSFFSSMHMTALAISSILAWGFAKPDNVLIPFSSRFFTSFSAYLKAGKASPSSAEHSSS